MRNAGATLRVSLRSESDEVAAARFYRNRSIERRAEIQPCHGFAPSSESADGRVGRSAIHGAVLGGGSTAWYRRPSIAAMGFEGGGSALLKEATRMEGAREGGGMRGEVRPRAGCGLRAAERAPWEVWTPTLVT
jgi:hypothetical protein